MQAPNRWIILFPLAAAALFTLGNNLLELAKPPAASEPPILSGEAPSTANSISRPSRDQLERSTRAQP